MSNHTSGGGFGQFVPGFEFLQSLASPAATTGQGMGAMPNLGSWVAPTLNVEDLEKRIEELKAVHFWLDQNSKALSATIQAMEVQKMTLATLRDLNVNFGDMAKAGESFARAAAQPDTTPEAPAEVTKPTPRSTDKKSPAGTAPEVDPVQWWGALQQQFQNIAVTAMQDLAEKSAPPAAAAPKAKKSGPPRKTAAAKKPAASRSRKRS